MTEPLRKGDDLRVGPFGIVKERGMTGVLPHPEHEVPEIGVHEVPNLFSVDKFVHSAVQNEVGDGLAGGHQSSFVLGVWEGPVPDIRVLTGKGTHLAVLDSLIQFIPVSNESLDELLDGRSEISEGWVQELQGRVESELGSHEG